MKKIITAAAILVVAATSAQASWDMPFFGDNNSNGNGYGNYYGNGASNGTAQGDYRGEGRGQGTGHGKGRGNADGEKGQRRNRKDKEGRPDNRPGFLRDFGFYQTRSEGAGYCCGAGIQNEKARFVGAVF